MFCIKCGKEISDQAKFCNFCGAQMNVAQPAQAQPVQPTQQQTAAPKKKGKAGKTILTIIIAAAVFFGVRQITYNTMTGGGKTDNSTTNSTGVIEVTGIDQPSLTDACFYGALYQNGELTYGMTKLSMPGYTLVPGEGDERDYLMSADGNCLFTANKQLEIMNASFDATTEEGMMASFSNYSDATMVEFEKKYINDYPVIRYIVRCTVDGTDQYIGEAIVFPAETAKETIRLDMYQLAESGYGEIDRVFDTLNIYPHFAPTYEDTNVIGLNRITVK